MDFMTEQREAMFDDTQLYAVYSREDIEMLKLALG